MKFSIVTISFNQAKFLERTVLSVITQQAVDVEYIIVDPGSTDGSRDIIEKYRGKFSQIVLEKDAGPADGLNKGFELATGDWFGYINSDDFYLPGGLHRAAIAAQRNPRAGAIVGNGYIVDENDAMLRRSVSTKYSRLCALHGACFSLQQATFYNATAYRAVNGFNIANTTCWDAEILVDLSDRGYRIERIYEDVGAFRIHPQSITGSGRLFLRYRRDADAVFRKAMGRERNQLDRLLTAPVLRSKMMLFDPKRTTDLTKDRLGLWRGVEKARG